MAKWKRSSSTQLTPKDVEALKSQGVDTLPKYLLLDYKKYGDRKVAMRHKDFGIWNSYTWADCYHHIKDFALGLVSLGLEKGDKVLIIGDNEPEGVWAQIATQAVEGIPSWLYVDALPSEVEWFVNHAESKFAVANDQEQTDKFLEIKDKAPSLKKVIYWNPKGMWSYKNNPFVINFKDVEELGKEYDKEHPGFFEESIEGGKGNDIALLGYSSGTTGATPKGAVINYDYLINGSIAYATSLPVSEDEEYLSFVPMAWAAEQLMGINPWLVYGVTMNFAESSDTVMENMREIGPAVVLLGTRLWESLLSTVQMKINDSSFLKKLVYHLSLPIGYKVADYRLKGQRVPLFWKSLYQIANWVCFRPIRDQLGLEHTEFAMGGGTLMCPDTFRFFLAIGAHIKITYGLVESTPICSHRLAEIGRPETLGAPMYNCEVRISDEGEIEARNDRMFLGYYKAPEATAAMMDGDFIKTGDAGFIDEADGHVIMLDRLKEMLKLRGGYKYSSAYLENSLKFSPYIKDAMIIGGEERDYIFCIINIDFDNVGKWAERNWLSYTTFTDLSQKQEVYDLILKDVERVNRVLPERARVKKYSHLYKEFDPDEGELTRTRKLRRKFLEERYSQLIEAAYNDQEQVSVETEVKYRDGRKGKITTPVYIKTMEW